METGLKLANVRLNATEAAKMIRADLKKAFPGIKFSVRSSYFSGGSSVDVRYTDGPLTGDVEKIVNMYGGRGYDGMNEVTLYHDGALRLTADGPVSYSTGSFLNVQREWSDGVRDAIIGDLNARYGTSADRRNDATVNCDGSSIWEPLGKSEYVWTLAHRKFSRTEYPSGREACYYHHEIDCRDCA